MNKQRDAAQDHDDLTSEKARALRMESDAEALELFIIDGRQFLHRWENGVIGGKVIKEEIGPSHPLFAHGLND